MKARSLAVAAVAIALAAPLPALAQDTYNIGLTGALTGPPASTYAPAVDALRIYIDRVNAAGGINGKKINLILQDDSAQPGKAAANAKKLLTQDSVTFNLRPLATAELAPVLVTSATMNFGNFASVQNYDAATSANRLAARGTVNGPCKLTIRYSVCPGMYSIAM